MDPDGARSGNISAELTGKTSSLNTVSLITTRFLWMVLVFLATMIGNTILITVSLRNRSYRNITNFFNLNLAVSDIIKVIFFIPTYLVYCYKETWQLGIVACRTFLPIFYTAFVSSLLLLMCLSWERYNLVVKPLKTQMKLYQARLLALACWVISLIMAGALAPNLNLIQADGSSIYCWFVNHETSAQAIFLFVVVTLGAFPLAFFIVTYFKMIRKLKSDGVSPADDSQSSVNRARRNRRAITILLTEVVVFIACIVPFYFVSVKSLFVPFNETLHPFSWESLIIYGMMATFSAVNPLLHGFFNSEFRKEVKILFAGVNCLEGSAEQTTEQNLTKLEL